MAAPAAPTLTVEPEPIDDGISITIDNPPASGAGTVDEVGAADYNDLYRKITGDNPWFLLTTVSPNSTYNDYEAASGVSYSYRAKAVNVDGESGYSTTEQGTISYNRWWIRNLSDSTRDIRNPFIDNDPLSIESKEEQAVFNPLQRRFPVVIKDKGIKAARFNLSIQFLGEQSFLDFEYLRGLQTTLLLQSPMERQWYFVFDNSGREKVHNTTDAYRHMEIGIIEVERPNAADIVEAEDYYGKGGY